MSGRPVLVVGLLALLAGCAGQSLTGAAFRPDIYVVRSGDTLYSIAWRYGLDHQKLQRWNDIESPDRLQVGQRLRLSPGEPPSAGREADSRPPDAGGGGSPAKTADAAAEERAPSAAADGEAGPSEWRWPAEGPVIGTFDEGRVTGRGIDLGGELDSPVQAAADGEVVYSGRGLQAYGQLVIIRHGREFLSAYAHNNRLLVKEGQQVVAGQQIANMGETNNGQPLLHFEIRRQGTPVDPLDYLPARP